jgi:hypothetical protein
MDGGDVHRIIFVRVFRVRRAGVSRCRFASWLSLATNGLKVLPHNWRGGHEIAKAQAGSLLGLGLGGGVMPESRCQCLPKPDLSYDQPDDGQTEHGDADSENVANEGICFHGPTLSRAAPRVLIERNHSAIDRSDEGEKRWLLPPCMELRGGGASAAGWPAIEAKRGRLANFGFRAIRRHP